MASNHIEFPTTGRPIWAWTKGVLFEDQAREQLERVSNLPFIHHHVAVMPDVHAGIGATVGSVLAMESAIIPAAVGVDLGCGICAVKTTLCASDLPDNLKAIRSLIESVVPHGRTDQGGQNDTGAWRHIPADVSSAWAGLEPAYKAITYRYPQIEKANTDRHLGTLGSGNHFIEMCLDENQNVWIMLHSGSRGVGNRIGSVFIELAKKDMKTWFINLPDQDLAYFPEGTEHYQGYLRAVKWAQEYALVNRKVMMTRIQESLNASGLLKPFELVDEAINCHHNYVATEKHFGKTVHVTRKGAVRAGKGDLGVIPGSMGARSYIVRGLGNPLSFCSCSHGAGRVMSRTLAKKTFTLEDHRLATAGVECRQDDEVLDETPKAYKDIEAVMAAQSDLVETIATLKQVLCVKG